MWSRVLSRACVLAVSCIVSSSSARADATILWLAAGAHGAPCTAPEACAAGLGLACFGARCVESGGDGETCRSPEYPGKTRCDSGLACEDTVCVPAGGNGQVCRSCESDSNASNLACYMDRCGTSLGCNPTSFTCEPAGGRHQPCRELDFLALYSQPTCDHERVCVSGTCVEPIEEGLSCSDLKCSPSSFCEQTGSGGYAVCSVHPCGLISNATTAQATQCVTNVEGKFAALAASGGGYTNVYSFDAHEGERLRPEQATVGGFDSDWNVSPGPGDWDRDHVQSILRLPGSKFNYLISHSSNDDGPAGLMIANRREALYLFPYDREPTVSNHPGGMSMFGNTVAVAVEHGGVGDIVPCSDPAAFHNCREAVNNNLGWVDLWTYDEGNSKRPLTFRSQVKTDMLPGKNQRISSVAYTRLTDGRGLMFVLGARSAEGWLLAETKGGEFGLLKHFANLYETHMIPGHHPFSNWKMYQNIHFVTDCTGVLYLVASAGSDDLLPRNRENYVDLYRLEASSNSDSYGALKLKHVNAWQPTYSNERCEGRYGANPVISNGELSYICSTGLTSAPEGNGDNIGVAEINTVRYGTMPEPGTICCGPLTPTGLCPSRAKAGQCP